MFLFAHRLKSCGLFKELVGAYVVSVQLQLALRILNDTLSTHTTTLRRRIRCFKDIFFPQHSYMQSIILPFPIVVVQ